MPRFVRSSANAADGPAFSVPSGSWLAAGPPPVVESLGGPPHATAAVSNAGAATASSRFRVAPLGSRVIALLAPSARRSSSAAAYDLLQNVYQSW